MVSIEILILQINWSADAGKGCSACDAHCHQPPRLSTFEKQFLLKCLFFRSTGAKMQAKRAVRVAHTSTSPLVLVSLMTSFFRSRGADSGKGRITGGAHSYQPPCPSTFDKQFLLKCIFFRSTGAQTQAKGAAHVVHTPTSPLILVPLTNDFYCNAYSTDALERRRRQRNRRTWRTLPPSP